MTSTSLASSGFKESKGLGGVTRKFFRAPSIHTRVSCMLIRHIARKLHEKFTQETRV